MPSCAALRHAKTSHAEPSRTGQGGADLRYAILSRAMPNHAVLGQAVPDHAVLS